MASDEKWYFSKEQLDNTPSRQSGFDAQKELVCRQQAAYFIQDMGQRLRVSQLCINTASVYMHRFYVFHSFTNFPWSSIAAAALFLAAKVEEQPRKLEHVIRVHNICKNSRDVQFDVQSERYQQQSQDLVFNENILLQTLGFDVAIDHPHAHVVKCCQLVRASKDLGQTSYFMASTSLHLTTMCLQYKPTVVACFCIHLACKWSNWEIPLSNESREWFSYVDTSVTSDMLAQLTDEFLTIFSRCPSRLKDKIMAVGDGANINRNLGHPAMPGDGDRKAQPAGEAKDGHHRSHHHEKTGDDHKHRNSGSSSGAPASNANSHQREYAEKKAREQVPSFYPKHPHKVQQQAQHASSSSGVKGPLQHGQAHRMPVDAKMKSAHPRTNNPNWETYRDAAGVCDKDAFAARCEKDEKRARPPPTTTKSSETNSTDAHNADKRGEPARTRSQPIVDPKHVYKHDARGGHAKNDAERKAHSSSQPNLQPTWLDSFSKSNLHQHTKAAPMNNSGIHASLPKVSDTLQKSGQKVVAAKQEASNGVATGNGSYANDCNDVKPMPDVPIKKPSMFSPEKTPPRKAASMGSIKSASFNQLASSTPHIPSKASSNHVFDGRSKKVEHSDGFESMLRESSLSCTPAMIKSEAGDLSLGDGFTSTFSTPFASGNFHQSQTPMTTYHPVAAVGSMPPPPASAKANAKDHKSLDMLLASSTSNLSQPIVNGIETNPTLISNLLKEAPSVPHLTTIANASNDTPAPLLDEARDSHPLAAPKDKKKKNKEKHKHKDKSREEREKKRKHKDKDKEKHKSRNREKSHTTASSDDSLSQPIKIKISKDKIQASDAPPTAGGGLKIKIPKDKIKSDIIEQPGAIRIKIPKDVMHIGGAEHAPPTGKKRDRDRSSPTDGGPQAQKVGKYSRQQGIGEKQNGRSAFAGIGKVGEDESMPLHCIIKGMSSST